MASLVHVNPFRAAVGYLIGAATSALVLAPFILRQEYCHRPTFGGVLIAAISGLYLVGRLVRGEGSLGAAPVAQEMPAHIRAVGDGLAIVTLVIAGWFIVWACRGSDWPP